jgi:hypothetical protein
MGRLLPAFFLHGVGNNYFMLSIILSKNKLEELSKSTKLVFFLVFLTK